MGKNLAAALIAMCLTVSGCATTQQVANRLGNQYIGGNFDEFVIKNGAPYKSFKLSSGDTMYEWSSGISSVAMPGTATTNVVGNTATTHYQPGGNMEMVCDIQFRVDKNNIVKAISILQDSFGFWSTSRCDEVLRK